MTMTCHNSEPSLDNEQAARDKSHPIPGYRIIHPAKYVALVAPEIPSLVCFDLPVNSLLKRNLECVMGTLASGTDGANSMHDLGPSCYARVGYRMTVLRHGPASV